MTLTFLPVAGPNWLLVNLETCIAIRDIYVLH